MALFTSLSKAAGSTALHISEWVVLLFGLLLVVGLIGELIPSLPRWNRAFEVMVILGVAGELVGDAGVFVSSERLQEISDAEVAQAHKESSAANERAAILQLHAARL